MAIGHGSSLKRAKEYLPEEFALSPVRMLGGFICVDFHIGCFGCSYCLNRRDATLRSILNDDVHLDLKDIDITPDSILKLLRRSHAFTEARVPVRIGHMTDWHYEIRDADRFCRMLPDDYPCVLLSRFPLTSKQCQLVADQDNLLAHVTLTPEAPGLSPNPVLLTELIDSTRILPRDAVVYMIRPLAEGAEEGTRQLLESLPAGSSISMVHLSTRSIPTIGDARKMDADSIRELEVYAKDLGHRVLAFFGCALRSRLSIPFFRFITAMERKPDACLNCSNRSVCEEAKNLNHAERINEAAWSIGIEPGELVRDGGSYMLNTETPTGRGDEIYLSELTRCEVLLSSVPRFPKSSRVMLDSSILDRWQHSKVLDVAVLEDWSRKIRFAYMQNRNEE